MLDRRRRPCPAPRAIARRRKTLAAASRTGYPWAQREARMALAEGKPAPDFALPDEEGRTVRLSDFRGRTVVVFFYPKAGTSG